MEPTITLAYSNPKLKIGDKIAVLTNEDHRIMNTTSQTSAWGMSAEMKYCHKTYTVTEQVYNRLKQEKDIAMYMFPESDDSWIMHYADFKMATVICLVNVNVYQILEVNEDKIQNVLLTFNERQADTMKEAKEKANTDPKTKFTKITFKLQKKEEKELSI